ncbi:MAG: hypothetical protein QM692_06440 [Thermomicrobiales bacterium]
MAEVPPFGENLEVFSPDGQPLFLDRRKVALTYHAWQQRGEFPEAEAYGPFCRMLETCITRPVYWTMNGPEFLGVLVMVQALALHYRDTPEDFQRLSALYDAFVATAPEALRLAVVDDIAMELPAGITLYPLWAMFYREQSVEIVKFIVRSIARLETPHPWSANNLSGVMSLTTKASEFRQDGLVQWSMVIAALLEFGDERMTGYLTRCGFGDSPADKHVLAHYHSQTIFAAAVEYFLQWLEGTGEEDFGHPAGALARIAAMDQHAPGVWAVHWRFPAPPALEAANPETERPAAVHLHWDKQTFARIIEPRLRLAFARESNDYVMPLVLEAWRLPPGNADPQQQERLAVEAWEWAAERLRRGFAGERPEIENHLDHEAVSRIRQTFTGRSPRDGLRHALRDLEEPCHRDTYDDEMPALLEGPFREQWRVLQTAFGPDPCSALGEMDRLAEEEELRSASQTLSDREFGERFSRLVETAADLHAARHVEIALLNRRFARPVDQAMVQRMLDGVDALERAQQPLQGVRCSDICVPLQVQALFACNVLAELWRVEVAAFAAGLQGDAARNKELSTRARTLNAAATGAWADLRSLLATNQAQQRDVVARSAITRRACQVIAGHDWNSPSSCFPRHRAADSPARSAACELRSSREREQKILRWGTVCG